MGDKFRRLPSPSMGVAFIALLAALGGTAVALPGSSTVTSGDIKNSQVKTQDIRNSTIRGRDVRANTLTGSDVNEGSLGKVDSATKADTATSATTATNATTAGNGYKAIATVTAAGAIVPTRSKGVTGVTINTALGAGAYCFNLPFTALAATASNDNFSGDGGGIDAGVAPNVGACPAGFQDARVQTYAAGAGPIANRAFTVVFW